MIFGPKKRICKKCKKSFMHHELDDGELDDYCPNCAKAIINNSYDY